MRGPPKRSNSGMLEASKWFWYVILEFSTYSDDSENIFSRFFCYMKFLTIATERWALLHSTLWNRPKYGTWPFLLRYWPALPKNGRMYTYPELQGSRKICSVLENPYFSNNFQCFDPCHFLRKPLFEIGSVGSVLLTNTFRKCLFFKLQYWQLKVRPL